MIGILMRGARRRRQERKPLVMLKVYHRIRHDSDAITDIETNDPVDTIQKIKNTGGFWGRNREYFVPWHSIRWVAVVPTWPEKLA